MGPKTTVVVMVKGRRGAVCRGRLDGATGRFHAD